jgi:hypothetical protein
VDSPAARLYVVHSSHLSRAAGSISRLRFPVRQSGIGHTIAGAGMASAIERIEQESRQSVRALEVDPAADPAAVRRIVEEVIAAYRDRAISLPMPALGDPDVALRSVLDNITAMGRCSRFSMTAPSRRSG